MICLTQRSFRCLTTFLEMQEVNPPSLLQLTAPTFTDVLDSDTPILSNYCVTLETNQAAGRPDPTGIATKRWIDKPGVCRITVHISLETCLRNRPRRYNTSLIPELAAIGPRLSFLINNWCWDGSTRAAQLEQLQWRAIKSQMCPITQRHLWGQPDTIPPPLVSLETCKQFSCRDIYNVISLKLNTDDADDYLSILSGYSSDRHTREREKKRSYTPTTITSGFAWIGCRDVQGNDLFHGGKGHECGD